MLILPAAKVSFRGSRLVQNDGRSQESSGASWIRNMPYQNKTVVKALDEFYRSRLRVIAGLDDMVSDLVTRLDQHGILDSTYIIYTTDNGYHIGQHRLGPGKKCGIETDVNIPMVMRGPGIPAGKVTDLVTTHTDLAPTFLQMLGLPQRTEFDGKVIPTSEATMAANSNASFEHVNVEHWGVADPYEAVFHGDYNITGAKNNTYKSMRVFGSGYNLYYSVWCTNEHELYVSMAFLLSRPLLTSNRT
jgi:arylsulfatase A-like enzyme